MAKSIPFAAKPGKIAKAASGMSSGRVGGIIQKAMPGPGHQKQATTPVKTDRGSFGLKG